MIGRYFLVVGRVVILSIIVISVNVVFHYRSKSVRTTTTAGSSAVMATTPMDIDDDCYNSCHQHTGSNRSGVLLSLEGIDADDVSIQIASDLHGACPRARRK
jgi:hypothetical protein